MKPAGQDSGCRSPPGTVTVPLRSHLNASPFWIIFVLVLEQTDQQMIPLSAIGPGAVNLPRQELGSRGRSLWRRCPRSDCDSPIETEASVPIDPSIRNSGLRKDHLPVGWGKRVDKGGILVEESLADGIALIVMPAAGKGEELGLEVSQPRRPLRQQYLARFEFGGC